MPTFKTTTETFDYFRKKAQELDCDPCFDPKIKEIEAMNAKGNGEKPGCLCRIGEYCPCDKAKEEIERDGSCYCEIFARLKNENHRLTN